MSNSVNKGIIIGRVGKDPTTRDLKSGGRVVSFSVATSERWTDKATGEKKEDTTWHNVVVFDTRLAEIAEKMVRKGVNVYVEGAIKTRKYTDKEGIERYVTEIVLAAFRGALTLLTPGSGPVTQREGVGPHDPDAEAEG
jgi:single-strand DNA-binding protein